MRNSKPNAEELDKIIDFVKNDLDAMEWNKIPYGIRLIATKYVMARILEHIKEGGTYRYLIYDRLGFDKDAYSYLLEEGMTISNDCNMRE
jgi:hypothetical protein